MIPFGSLETAGDEFIPSPTYRNVSFVVRSTAEKRPCPTSSGGTAATLPPSRTASSTMANAQIASRMVSRGAARSDTSAGMRVRAAATAASAIRIRSPFWVPTAAISTRLVPSAPTMAPTVFAA